VLTLPDQPLLDKVALIGACTRLPVTIDRARLLAEVEALPEDLWGQRGGRVGVHTPAQAIFLRGYAPAQGDLPVEDRDALQHLPYVRELIEQVIPAQPLRCLIALLPAGAVIAPHIDQADYFSKTIRLHIPITSNDNVWMFCAGHCYRMRPGELWALNNSTVHGVLNADADASRMHLICDFLCSAELVELLRSGERDLGERNPAVEARLHAQRTQAQRA
jgi:hypothetical protein